MNREILRLAIPNIIANISVPMLGIVDTALVGHMEAVYYIGALAVGTMVFNFIYFGMGFLSMGTSGLTAQAWGAQNQSEVGLVFWRALTVALSMSILLILLQIPLVRIGFHFVDATPEVLEHASSYFHIRIWAAPATLSLMVVQGWFIGIQNARTPMMLTISVNVFNILGNLIFVYGFGMNSDGVAYGTVCAQYLGLLIAFKILSAMVSPLKNPVNWRKVLQLSALKQYFYINFDLFLRTLNLIVVFAFFTLASSWQSGVILAANSILMQPWAFNSFALDGFAYAAQSLVGRFIGAGDVVSLKRCIRYLLLWCTGIALIFSLVYFLFGEWILAAFTDKEDVIRKALEYWNWVVLGTFLGSFAYIWDGIYIGATATRSIRNAMLICGVVFFCSYWIFIEPMGNHGLWTALTIFMIARGLILTVMAPACIYRKI